MTLPSNPIVPSRPGRPTLNRIERLLWPDEACDWLCISQRRLVEEVRRGRLTAVSFGGKRGLRFEQDAIRSYIASLRFPQTTTPQR